MKGQRIRKEIKKFIANHEGCTTSDIKHYLNNKYKHGTRMASLVNFLGKDKEIIAVGMDDTKGGWSQFRWGLRD